MQTAAILNPSSAHPYIGIIHPLFGEQCKGLLFHCEIHEGTLIPFMERTLRIEARIPYHAESSQTLKSYRSLLLGLLQ